MLFGSRGRTFAPYQQWEDYKAGMFGGRFDEARSDSAGALLADPPRCLLAMSRVVREWPVAASVNLTNTGLNRRAWVGQSACCLAVGATANETKRAWWQLTDTQRAAANACADEVIALWHTERE
jgi:hypothetical protein